MASVYISYQHEDADFVESLNTFLVSAGHTVTYDKSELSPGVDWRKTLSLALKNAEVFIVVISQNSPKSSYLPMEVGAARAYSEVSNRMLLIPIVIDDGVLPHTIQDIQAIIQRDANLHVIVPQIEKAISTFIGRNIAFDAAAKEQAKEIKSSTDSYVQKAIDSLHKLEGRDRKLSYGCISGGFSCLLMSIAFAVYGISEVQKMQDPGLQILVLMALKATVVVGLLGVCSKTLFTLGASYYNESLKSSDRIHAIRFGEFYLGTFGTSTEWSELKEVFQHWNIDRNSSTGSLGCTALETQSIAPLLDIVKTLSEKIKS